MAYLILDKSLMDENISIKTFSLAIIFTKKGLLLTEIKIKTPRK